MLDGDDGSEEVEGEVDNTDEKEFDNIEGEGGVEFSDEDDFTEEKEEKEEESNLVDPTSSPSSSESSARCFNFSSNTHGEQKL